MFRHADHFLHNHPHNASNRQFRQFYISTSLYTFALSFSQRFIPIYLYTLGYDVAAIGLFYVVHYAFRLFTTIPAAWLVLSERFKSLNVPTVPAGRQLGFLQSS